MFSKVLVANRGEIAVRAFRAAYELGAPTVAVYPYEDRNAVHRIKADEAYLIGERGHPVRAYLDVDEIIRAARESGADAIYPGYGFLSENPELAQACAATPASPSSARRPTCSSWPATRCARCSAAKAAGIPTLRSTPPSADLDELVAGRRGDRLPGLRQGGRRWRRPRHAPGRRPGEAARVGRGRDARGRGRVRRPDRVHRAGRRPSAPHRGADPGRQHRPRDAPVRARLLDPAPAPEGGRDRPGAQHLRRAAGGALRATRWRSPTSIDYSCAGTVEFLVETEGERAGQHVFIEMNPRIQVEHTVTEEITDVDLVQSQMRIASGETLADLGLSQETVRINGAALQCRITTEDPANGFRPDTGTHHRLPLRRRRRRPARRRHRRHRRGDQRRTSTRCWSS